MTAVKTYFLFSDAQGVGNVVNQVNTAHPWAIVATIYDHAGVKDFARGMNIRGRWSNAKARISFVDGETQAVGSRHRVNFAGAEPSSVAGIPLSLPPWPLPYTVATNDSVQVIAPNQLFSAAGWTTVPSAGDVIIVANDPIGSAFSGFTGENNNGSWEVESADANNIVIADDGYLTNEGPTAGVDILGLPNMTFIEGEQIEEDGVGTVLGRFGHYESSRTNDFYRQWNSHLNLFFLNEQGEVGPVAAGVAEFRDYHAFLYGKADPRLNEIVQQGTDGVNFFDSRIDETSGTAVITAASCTFAASTKIITLGSGSWLVTPKPGDKITVSGTVSNNGDLSVAASSSNTITVRETLVDETVSTTITNLTGGRFVVYHPHTDLGYDTSIPTGTVNDPNTLGLDGTGGSNHQTRLGGLGPDVSLIYRWLAQKHRGEDWCLIKVDMAHGSSALGVMRAGGQWRDGGAHMIEAQRLWDSAKQRASEIGAGILGEKAGNTWDVQGFIAWFGDGEVPTAIEDVRTATIVDYDVDGFVTDCRANFAGGSTAGFFCFIKPHGASYLDNPVQPATFSVLSAASATIDQTAKTITIGSGTWANTPAAISTVTMAGWVAGGNNATFTVLTATSTVITVLDPSNDLVTETASVTITTPGIHPAIPLTNKTLAESLAVRSPNNIAMAGVRAAIDVAVANETNVIAINLDALGSAEDVFTVVEPGSSARTERKWYQTDVYVDRIGTLVKSAVEIWEGKSFAVLADTVPLATFMLFGQSQLGTFLPPQSVIEDRDPEYVVTAGPVTEYITAAGASLRTVSTNDNYHMWNGSPRTVELYDILQNTNPGPVLKTMATGVTNAISFTAATKTIATTGTWIRTPAVGDSIFVALQGGGVLSNVGAYTVASATASTVVVVEAISDQAASSTISVSIGTCVDSHPQTNFDGDFYGPEGSLFRFMVEAIGQELLVIKCVFASSTLTQLADPRHVGEGSATGVWDPDAENLFTFAVKQVERARDTVCAMGRAIDMIGFGWMQGYSDMIGSVANQAVYQPALERLIDESRERMGNRALGPPPPFLVVRSPSYYSEFHSEPGFSAIRAAQMAVQGTREQVKWIDADVLEHQLPTATGALDPHLDGESVIEVGRILTNGFKDLVLNG